MGARDALVIDGGEFRWARNQFRDAVHEIGDGFVVGIEAGDGPSTQFAETQRHAAAQSLGRLDG